MYQKRSNKMDLLTIKDLKKGFPVKEGLFGKKKVLKAVDGVTFSIKKDRVFALVGESGCGKSTVARLILRLIDPEGGEVFFKGKDIFSLKGEELKKYRRSVQIVFQDPFASLNPRMRILETLTEPLKIHKTVPGKQQKEFAAALLDQVGLDRDVMYRYPHEFSGGQRQRICIARALALSPEVIIADEPLSSLDVSIQAQILNLLKDLKEKQSLAFLFISHDLEVVRYFSDEIAVMYLGKIVEMADTNSLFDKPMHPYTELLIDSIPAIPRGEKKERPFQEHDSSSDAPSPLNIPPGCPFHPRCRKKKDNCDKATPDLIEAQGRLISCHLWN